MIRTIVLGAVVATTLAFAVPFAAGATPVPQTDTSSRETTTSIPANSLTRDDVSVTAPAPQAARPTETSVTAASAASASEASSRGVAPALPDGAGTYEIGYAITPPCQPNPTGTVPDAPSVVSPGGVQGTTSDDLASFAIAFDQIRIANCLPPVPLGNFHYDACVEQRLFWMAEDPSENPASAWGHIGTVRSDGVPSVGCDGNLAGGMNNTGTTLAQKWWASTDHRLSLYKPSYTGSMAGVCIHFAMTHGGVPDEPVEFIRAAAYWGGC